MLKERYIILFMKLCFSAVIMLLLYISLCISAYEADSVAASEVYPMLSKVPEMLEVAAASATLTVGGGLLMEYVRKKSL